jgi:hypothetical protein
MSNIDGALTSSEGPNTIGTAWKTVWVPANQTVWRDRVDAKWGSYVWDECCPYPNVFWLAF